MRGFRVWVPVLALAALAACGGGGGGGGGGDGAAAVEPTVAFVLDEDNLTDTLALGDELSFRLAGHWSSSDAGLTSLYLQVVDGADAFVPAAPVASDGTVALDLAVRSVLPVGLHESQLQLRACRDAACANPLPGSATIAYRLTVDPVSDWSTHQGSNAHRGAVPIRLDPSKFEQAWSWRRPAGTEPIGGINPVVTSGGKVFVTTDVYFGEGATYALAESDGHEVWVRSLGSVPALNPPAVGGGKVYAAVTGHEQTFLYAFSADTGAFLHKSAFEGQWPHFLAPTIDDELVYQGGGYYGGMVYGFSSDDGERAWSADVGGAWDMFSVAADAQHAYHHNGAALHVLNRATGESVAHIADAFGNTSGYAYHGGPVIGTRGMVMSFAGAAFSGRASANTEQFEQRILSGFDVADRRHVWSSARSYLTVPATADGVLYAARNAPAVLDAIDELTGQTLWSFQLPPEHGDSFHRNIIVTRKLLFASTDTKVLAIDLATRKVVWSQPTPGMLALSAGRTLYIATGATESDGRLLAIRLY